MLNEKISSGCRAFPKFLCKTLTIGFVAKMILVITIVYYVTSYVHTSTYIWQCTLLADTVRPVSRHSCPASVHPDWTNETVALHQQPKIGLIMVYDDNYGGSDKELVPRLIKNRENYCYKHGCSVIRAPPEDSHDTKNARPPAWGKLTAMLAQLKTNKYDYVLYVDMDMVIMNPSISPESILHQAPKSQDFILTNDWSGVNTGIMFARNSNFSKWFLQTAWDQGQLVNKYSTNGVAHPFEYEQRAFHFLLDTPVWQQRDLPRYRGNSSELRRHFTALPQCSMNSYVLHPLEFRADREVSHFVDSDFIVHLAGKKGQVKMDLMNYFLDIAEEEY